MTLTAILGKLTVSWQVSSNHETIATGATTVSCRRDSKILLAPLHLVATAGRAIEASVVARDQHGHTITSNRTSTCLTIQHTSLAIRLVLTTSTACGCMTLKTHGRPIRSSEDAIDVDRENL